MILLQTHFLSSLQTLAIYIELFLSSCHLENVRVVMAYRIKNLINIEGVYISIYIMIP